MGGRSNFLAYEPVDFDFGIGEGMKQARQKRRVPKRAREVLGERFRFKI